MSALVAISLLSGFHGPHLVSADEGETGTVYSHFYGCDTSKVSVYQDHGHLKNNCTESTYYINWSLMSEGKDFSPKEGNTPADVSFENVPEHIFTLTGDFDIYSGPAIVYCQNGEEQRHG